MVKQVIEEKVLMIIYNKKMRIKDTLYQEMIFISLGDRVLYRKGFSTFPGIMENKGTWSARA